LKSRASKSQTQGQVRIIGGNWRRRKVSFQTLPDLRPTGDRIRETLFNWLAPQIDGSRCLELYAGSGILSLEALSRGAAFTAINDNEPMATRAIRETLNTFNCETARFAISHVTAADWVNRYRGEPFDIIFLDPPFDSSELLTIPELLIANGVVSEDSLIYVETHRAATFCPPASWQCHREHQGGQVHFALYVHQTHPPSDKTPGG